MTLRETRMLKVHLRALKSSRTVSRVKEELKPVVGGPTFSILRVYVSVKP